MTSHQDEQDTVRAMSRQKVLDEYERRATAIDSDLYASWNPVEIFFREHRRRLAVAMLQEANVFPQPENHCLEVGYGTLGWLGDLINWGVPCDHLHGIELDSSRASTAIEKLPSADLRIGDATEMPWNDETFNLVIVSTVITSLLDSRVREMMAKEITRVLMSGGSLLFYDFAVNNPRNGNVRKVTRRELAELFPDLSGKVRSVTLAPPIARRVVPRCWWFATALESLPFLRTHLMAVLVKRKDRRSNR